MSDDLTLTAQELGITAEQRQAIDAILADDELRPSAGAVAVGRPASTISRWLRTEAVRRYLGAALAGRRARHADIRDRVIQSLYGLASYDIADAIDTTPAEPDPGDDLGTSLLKMSAGGRLKPPHELPPALRAAVKKVKFGRHGWEYEFADRAQILLALLKHFGDIDRFGLFEKTGNDHGVTILYVEEEGDES